MLIGSSFLDFPLQLSAGVAAHCSCSLKPHARMGLLGDAEMGEALEPRWQEVPRLRVEGTAVPTQDLLVHPERK